MSNAFDQLLAFPKIGSGDIIGRTGNLVANLKSKKWWRKNPVIKIVGTNGKGSVGEQLAFAANDQGLAKVGLYTSPHIFRPHERIKLNGSPITDEDFGRILKQLQIHKDTGRFEILTTIALTYFAEKDVDLAVMEIGLGGRYDPVKVAPGRINILTSVDLEHTRLLGHSLAEIATEKAAVCKAGDHLISGVSKDLINLEEDYTVEEIGINQCDYAKKNQELCQKALSLFLGKPIALEGVKPVPMIGRFQLIHEQPDIIVDVAHTPKAIERAFQKMGKGKHQVFIALQKDKNLKEISKVIKAYDFEYVFVTGSADLMDHGDYRSYGLNAPTIHFKEFSKQLEQAKTSEFHSVKILCLGGFEIVRYVTCHFDKSKIIDPIKL